MATAWRARAAGHTAPNGTRTTEWQRPTSSPTTRPSATCLACRRAAAAARSAWPRRATRRASRMRPPTQWLCTTTARGARPSCRRACAPHGPCGRGRRARRGGSTLALPRSRRAPLPPACGSRPDRTRRRPAARRRATATRSRAWRRQQTARCWSLRTRGRAAAWWSAGTRPRAARCGPRATPTPAASQRWRSPRTAGHWRHSAPPGRRAAQRRQGSSRRCGGGSRRVGTEVGVRGAHQNNRATAT
jgi:hypothetical protein